MNIANASVLITGGSRGLGRALGRALAAEGASVVLVARGQEELNQTVEEIRSTGGKAYGIVDEIEGIKSVRFCICLNPLCGLPFKQVFLAG